MDDISTFGTENSELLYVAGLYEGEGTCYSGWRTKYNGYESIKVFYVFIAMNDLYPLEEVKRITGLGNISGPYINTAKKRNLYRYHIYGFKNVEAFITPIFSRLSPRRKEQACACLGDDFAYEMGM